MSRDTAGQPVTASGPGKSSGTKAPSIPPVPSPDTPEAGTAAATSASRSAAGKTSASGAADGAAGSAAGAVTPAAVTAPAGAKPAPAGAKPAPAGAKPSAAASTTTTGTQPAGAKTAAAPTAREPKAPHAVVPEKAPATPPTQKKVQTGPRRVRLAVSRLDPWSVMKLSFLLSIAIGIMIVVASVVFWLVLDGLHVFTEVNDMIVDVLGEETNVNILQFVELKRVVSLSTMIAIVDVVLLTALSTIAAFLYNVVAALVGGVHLTLTDE